MPTYHLAQVRHVLGRGTTESEKGLPDAGMILVNASDTHLLDFVLSVFDLRLKQDPGNLRVTSGPYYRGISNIIEVDGKQVIRDTKVLEGLLWELLEDLCSQGWEPFSSGSNRLSPASYTEDYCFRRVES